VIVFLLTVVAVAALVFAVEAVAGILDGTYRAVREYRAYKKSQARP
jgi:hypothetical protein